MKACVCALGLEHRLTTSLGRHDATEVSNTLERTSLIYSQMKYATSLVNYPFLSPIPGVLLQAASTYKRINFPSNLRSVGTSPDSIFEDL